MAPWLQRAVKLSISVKIYVYCLLPATIVQPIATNVTLTPHIWPIPHQWCAKDVPQNQQKLLMQPGPSHQNLLHSALRVGAQQNTKSMHLHHSFLTVVPQSALRIDSIYSKQLMILHQTSVSELPQITWLMLCAPAQYDSTWWINRATHTPFCTAKLKFRRTGYKQHRAGKYTDLNNTGRDPRDPQGPTHPHTHRSVSTRPHSRMHALRILNQSTYHGVS